MFRFAFAPALFVLAATAGTACADPAAVQSGDDASTTVAASSSTCLRETGSHITAAPDKCLNAPGTSHDRASIENTGAIDVGSALQTLDPSVTVRRH